MRSVANRLSAPGRLPGGGQAPFAVIALLFATAAWGAAFILVKRALDEIDVYNFLFLRFSLASAMMLAIFRRRIVRASRASIRASLLVGLFLPIAYITQTEGLKWTNAANSALITCLYMVLVPLFSASSKARAGVAPWIGIMLAVAGMYLLTAQGLTGVNRGDLITLASAVAFAWHIILTGRYSGEVELAPLVAFQFVIVAVACGAIAAARGSLTLHISPFAAFTVVATAAFATVAAFLIQAAAQRVLAPARAGVILSMEAVFGAGIAWAVEGEVPPLMSLAGAIIMVAGMLFSELKGGTAVPTAQDPVAENA